MTEKVICYEKTDSTNLRIRELAETGAEEGVIALAKEQSAGKGRRGRTWDSPKGDNLYMSILLRPHIDPSMASMLTLIMAYSVAVVLQKQFGTKTQIKWPNDLVLDDKKICGILTEMIMEENAIGHVIVGIGININRTQFADELLETATALHLGENISVNPESLAQNIRSEFWKHYTMFLEEENFAFLKEDYEALLVNKGRQVCVLDPAGSYEGKAIGVSDAGELLVEKADGQVEAVFAGEVSVRGIYGYV